MKRKLKPTPAAKNVQFTEPDLIQVIQQMAEADERSFSAQVRAMVNGYLMSIGFCGTTGTRKWTPKIRSANLPR